MSKQHLDWVAMPEEAYNTVLKENMDQLGRWLIW